MFSKQQITHFLQQPVVDKTLGALALSATIYNLVFFAQQFAIHGYYGLFPIMVAAQQILSVVFVSFRRKAVRVSLNAFYWAVTFLRTYWVYLLLYYQSAAPSYHFLPGSVTNGVLILAMILLIYARLSLGRSMGFIPAQRKIITTGAYRYVRHPIQAAELLAFLGYLLSSPSAVMVFLVCIGAAVLIAKSFIEEDFLKKDEEYAAYCKHVRYRWIPGVI